MTGKSWRKLAMAGLVLMSVMWHEGALAVCETEVREWCEARRADNYTCDSQVEKYMINDFDTALKKPNDRTFNSQQTNIELFKSLAEGGRRDAAKERAKDRYPDLAARYAREYDAYAAMYECGVRSISNVSSSNQSSNRTASSYSSSSSNSNASSSSGNSAAQSSDPIVNDPAFAGLNPKAQKQKLAAREKAGERKWRNMSDCIETKPSHGSFRVYNHCNVEIEYKFCWTNDYENDHSWTGCEQNSYGGGFIVKPGKSDAFIGPMGNKGQDHRLYIAACESPGWPADSQWLGEPKGFSFKCR